jgi:hypothetical protein
MRMYGCTAEEVAAGKAMQIARGEAIGFKFDLEKRTHFYNTFDAHRLLFWASQEGRQIALKRALLRAYFADGQNPSDPETLVRFWLPKRGWMRSVQARCWRPEHSPKRCVNLKRFTTSAASIRYRPWCLTVVTWGPVRNRSSTTNRC